MGGCRCSYQGCTVKSDKKTHFFHYPVFDKVRCHQWLSNARKLDYLNLKVSQLKNRVVCEHHFRDDMFMNELHAKLRCDAVPTEDGPYNIAVELSQPYDPIEEIPLVGVEDIEEVVLTNSSDKKAVFSHKYGDFLTNLDIMDTLDTCNLLKSESISMKYEVPIITEKDNSVKLEPEMRQSPSIKKRVKTLKPVVVKDKDAMKMNIEIMNIPKEHDDINNPMYKYVIRQNPDICPEQTPSKNIECLNTQLSNRIVYESPSITANKYTPRSPRVKILSEERIEDPNKVKTCVITNNIQIDDKKNVNNPYFSQNQEINSFQKASTKSNNLSKEYIAEKRNFSRKLREVIKTSIDRMEDTIVLPPKPLEVKNAELTDTVINHLSSDENLPSIDTYAMSLLESRINKLENLILNKINDNTCRIKELKTLIHNQIDISKQKDSQAEQEKNPDYHKKKLYQEISQFLPTNVNSMVYEQLFLNKFERKKRDIDLAPNNNIKNKRSRRCREDNEV